MAKTDNELQGIAAVTTALAGVIDTLDSVCAEIGYTGSRAEPTALAAQGPRQQA